LKREFEAIKERGGASAEIGEGLQGIEPTNNNAERPLRRAVLWLRTSFGTQSESGSRFVERILTVVITLRQQGRDVLDYLTAVCASVTHKSASICLAPDSS
jgi:transposase